jgi:hypothetical protein
MFPGRPPIIFGRSVRPVVAKGVRWVKAHPLVSKAVPTAFGERVLNTYLGVWTIFLQFTSQLISNLQGLPSAIF